MGYSYQRYLIAVDDTIYRMANAAFDRMLRAPTTYCLPELAGQRVAPPRLWSGSSIGSLSPSSAHRLPSLSLMTRDALTPTGIASSNTRGLKRRWPLRLRLRLPTPTATKRSLTQPASSLLKAALGHPQLHWREPSAIPHLAVKSALVWATVPAKPRPLVLTALLAAVPSVSAWSS
jgi:hypothetical protein